MNVTVSALKALFVEICRITKTTLALPSRSCNLYQFLLCSSDMKVAKLTSGFTSLEL